MVDASDSKSDAAHPACRFESGLRQFKKDTIGCLFLWSDENRKTKFYFCSSASEQSAKGGNVQFSPAVTFIANEKEGPAFGNLKKTQSGVFFYGRTRTVKRSFTSVRARVSRVRKVETFSFHLQSRLLRTRKKVRPSANLKSP